MNDAGVGFRESRSRWQLPCGGSLATSLLDKGDGEYSEWIPIRRHDLLAT
jgi:hypothetical protein